MSRLSRLAGAALLSGRLLRALLGGARPHQVDLKARLAMLPLAGAPLARPVAIHWDDHQIPFIEAETDRDLAVALGVVHAHLRLAQLEILRRISQGRVAELAGPVAVDLDHALRIVEFGRAVPAMLAALPDDTRQFVDRFAAGLSHVVHHQRALPHEFQLLGVRPEPWTTADVLTLGRLTSADVSWLVWLRLHHAWGGSHWSDLWPRFAADAVAPIPSLAGGGLGLEAILATVARTGSNAAVVAGRRSAGGSALIASDPHLSLAIPNPWLLAGMRSPSYHAVGLMLPGIPAVALGRNPWIAWGGTSLHAASSDLVDVTDLPAGAIRTRTVEIGVRWGRPRRLTVRDTDYGPVLSDARMLGWSGGRQVALRWVGHHPTDEMTALLRLNRARSWDEFRDALDGFALPGQTMLYADMAGRIGQVTAVHLPRRRLEPPVDLVLPADPEHQAWAALVTGKSLPWRVDPPEGYIVSANNRPPAAAWPIGYFFSTDERARRMAALLNGTAPVDAEALRRLQLDVQAPAAHGLARHLVAVAEGQPLPPPAQALLEQVRAWDGRYDRDSTGAAAFETLLAHLVQAFYPADRLKLLTATWMARSYVREDLATAADDRLRPALLHALDAAAASLDSGPRWGDLHRYRAAHQLAAAPLVGRRYRWAEFAIDGANETVMKTAHPLEPGRHYSGYGVTARHISDLADPDANQFVLAGGQDGWIGSSTALDQLEAWRRGDYIVLPLTPEAARARCRFRTVLEPSPLEPGR